MNVVDMHCDTAGLFIGENPKSLAQNEHHLDLLKMRKGNYLLQNFAIFTHFKNVENHYDYAMNMIKAFKAEIEKNEDEICQVYTYQDIEDNIKENKISALLTLEEGAVVKGDTEVLKDYYDLGVRMIALTWNFENGIGFPNFTPNKELDRYTMLRITNKENGLTDFGIQYVKKMEELGMIVDVSHLSDKGFWDVLNNTTKPFVASHSNARSVCGVARNLDDEMIVALAKRGGVMGLNFCADFISEDGVGNIESIVDHIDHIVQVGGIDVIGLGSDFDGIPNRQDLEDGSKMPELYDAILRRGYSKEDADKIFYKNVLRLYKEVLK